MDNKLGDIISKLRKEKGLTQKDLAKELNISDKAVSRWETGNSLPDLDMIFRISKFFNVSFNDLIKLRVKSNEDENLVKDIIKEYSEMNKKNSKKLKFILITALVITIILVAVIIFTHTYNRFKVYRVTSNNDEIIMYNGVYVETRIKDTLYLGNLKIKNENVDPDDVIVEIYILDKDKKTNVFNYYSLNNVIFTNRQSSFKIDDLSEFSNNLYIKITYYDDNNEKHIFESKLNFEIDFTNNKVFYKEDFDDNLGKNKILDLDKDEIVDILLDNGFEKDYDNVLIKEIKNYTINFNIDLNTIKIVYEKNELNYKYIYKIEFNELDVNIFNSNNIEIENYRYDSKNDKILECVTGSCNNYKEAMDILDKNVLNLFKK